MNTSVIVYLLRSTSSDVNDIVKSLNSLYNNFLVDYCYPVIIFVENNFTEEFRNIIINNIHFKVIFQFIQFKSYSELNDNRIPNVLLTHNNTQKWPLGYRHMCRFWSGDFLHNEFICKYKYVWRMDSDAYIVSKISYDIFKYMLDNHINYSYSNITNDDAEVCKELHEFSKNFFKQKNIKFKWDLYKMFATHVEIIDMDTFKNSIYYDYYNEIDKTNNFYIHRWGDAPIRYIAVTNLNIKYNKLNIKYHHGNDGSGRKTQLLNETQPTII